MIDQLQVAPRARASAERARREQRPSSSARRASGTSARARSRALRVFMARRSRCPSAAASPCAAACWRPARRTHGSTRRSARAAAGPTRSPACRGAALSASSCDEQLARAVLAVDRAGGRAQHRQPQQRHARASSSAVLLMRSFSATRSSALRARGLRVEFRLRRRGCLRPMQLQPRLRAAAARTGRRASAGSSCDCALHEALDRAVLERVEADHREPPAGASTSSAPRKPALELPELVVDVHAQRLEGAGRRVLAGLARAHRARDQRGELRRCA